MAAFGNLLSSGMVGLSAMAGAFAWRLRFQENHSSYSVEGRRVQSKIQELTKQLGISKPIELVMIPGLMAGAQAQGIALFSGRAGIVIDPYVVYGLSEEELEFILAHELSHIKANDHLWMGVVSGIAGITATVAMSTLFPSSATSSSMIVRGTIRSVAAGVGLLVSSVATVFFSKWREECADKLGASVCSCSARKVAPEFFERARTGQIQYRNSTEGLLIKFLITPDGETRLDVLHPPLAARAQYLRELNP